MRNPRSSANPDTCFSENIFLSVENSIHLCQPIKTSNMNTYKIKENLFLKGDKVISYDTHVATVKGNQLIEKGKYSRTTGKHIALVARLLGLELVGSKASMKNTFDKYEYGVKCTVGDNYISWKTTKKIFDCMRECKDYLVALAILKSDIPKKDWELLDDTNKINPDIAKGASALRTFGVFSEEKTFV